MDCMFIVNSRILEFGRFAGCWKIKLGLTPYLPLFFGDFLASTATWDGEEQALYLLLLGYQWSSGPLPSELPKLARTVRYDFKVFTRLWKTVGRKFTKTECGLVNTRLEEHRTRSEQISSTNRARAKNAAEQRWSNARSMKNGFSGHAPSIALRSAAPMMLQNAIQSNPNEEEESEASQGGEIGSNH